MNGEFDPDEMIDVPSQLGPALIAVGVFAVLMIGALFGFAWAVDLWMGGGK